MTDEQLINAICSTPWQGTPEQSERVKVLALRGLRAEREVCGTCLRFYEDSGETCCSRYREIRKASEWCSRWEPKP